MKPSLADSLEVVLPNLPPELATAETRQGILAVARSLAPIVLGGFECRLGTDSQQVDFMQCIQVGEGQPDQLRQHLEAAPAVFKNDWLRIRDFCAAWADPSSILHRGVKDVWLEFDLDGQANSGVPLPSVFLALSEEKGAPSARAVLEAGLPLLAGQALPKPVSETLNRCFEACRDMAWVSHIGVMLPRAAQGLRLNVKGLNQETMPAFLARAGWQAPTGELEAVLAWLFELVDIITVCMDAGAQLSPRLGLECSFERQPDREAGWRVFLDQLAARGLATAPKGAALLNWVGTETPQSAALPWPGHLIAASLARPAEQCGLLGRRLSHIKLDLRQGQPTQAKGYIGFGHLWAKTDMFQRLRAEADDGTALEAAVSRAAAFLLGSRNDGGWWEDFRLPAGPSDEWVTAYVGTALAQLDRPEPQAAARQAWARLQERREGEPGWGYNSTTPTDADSTGWALQLAGRLGEAGTERAQAARQFLAGHRQADGGLATYGSDGPIRRWMDLPRPAPFGGWLASHACVTAAVAASDEWRGELSDYLRRTQCADGGWQAYWWCDHEYATALAAEALTGGAGDERARVAQAVEWARRRLRPRGKVTTPTRPGGSAFATAWCLRTLLLAEEREAVQAEADEAMKWLLRSQLPDGSWATSARLRVPPPEVLEPDRERENTLVTTDQQRNFTTTTVLTALRLVQRRQNIAG